MIKNFKQSWLEDFWNKGNHKKAPADLKDRILRKLDMLNAAKEIKDLISPPSNHLHQLHGDREGQWAISVNGPWRLCFRFDDGDIFDIEFVQYH
ncbi:MAG: type II toxin-antitoxin system RelE/ParE family toxin [Calditrichaceae bacterium]|nr:type II toxin-antitoxin system RelE/ParE family toxin [Calditrichaceae bacterium]